MSVETALQPQRATNRRPPVDRLKLLLVINVAAILTLAVGLRVWRLDNLPGVNGDEAWYGIQAMRLAGGHSVSLQTPTGNPANPFFLCPLAALHLFFEPSFAVLRLPALASGLAALAVNFWLCRRVFGRRAAWVSTLLLAVLPLNIAYCRFAWDASQSLLAMLLVVYLALELIPATGSPSRSIVPSLLAYGAAIWVHPTNIFAGCLLAPPIFYRYRPELRAGWTRLRSGRFSRHLWLQLVAGLLVAGWQFRPVFSAVFARIVHPQQWGLFLRLLVRLFSGSTVLEYIAGPTATSDALDAADLALGCVVGVAGYGLLAVLRNPRAARERALAIGFFWMAASFYLVAGPTALAPHFERYGVCLIAPGAILLALGLAWWLQPARQLARVTALTFCLVAWLALGWFWWRYFASIEHTGGQSHLAFRTAAIEPKQAAWDVVARTAGERPIVVIADSWWLYQPLAYLAAGRPQAQVLHWDEYLHRARDVSSSESIWLVEFCEPVHGTVKPSAAAAAERAALGRTGRTILIPDYSGRPLLVVTQAQAESADPGAE